MGPTSKLACEVQIPAENVCKNRHGTETSFTYRKISESNLKALCADLASADWSEVYREDDPERAYDAFCEIFIDLYNKHLPVLTKNTGKPQRNRKPWVTGEILKLIKQKNKYYKKYINSPLRNNYEKYADQY